MTTADTHWPALLLALDQPATPAFATVSEPVPGQGDGVEVPRDFDQAAAESRFEQLVERVEEAYGVPCIHGYGQDSACFGSIDIPADATRTRAKRTRTAFALLVMVSAFGNLATYRPVGQVWDQVVPVHPDDRRLIEEALDAVGYVIVPNDVLDLPYDGPNGWIFGSSPYERTDATWYSRFFDFL